MPVLQQIEAKVAALPSVDAETLTRIPLISGNAAGYTVVPEGHLRRANSNPSSLMNDVGQDFFSTFRIPILEGRPFNAGDTTTSQRVAVVNESFARKFFPDLNPLGRTFLAGRNHPVSMRIVGVCGDAKYYTMRRAPQPTFYEPYEQQTADVISHATFAVATRVSGSSLLPSIRDAVQSVDRNLPILNVRTQDEQVADNLRQERIFADLTGAFGVLALVLACIGIYGITAYSVSQRTNEIGIRMALGAEPGRVLRMVLREASWLGLLGVVAGLAGALALGRVIGAMLYGLKPWDPATLGASAVLLLVVALAAGWVPARRAAGVDPMRALRHE